MVDDPVVVDLSAEVAADVALLGVVLAAVVTVLVMVPVPVVTVLLEATLPIVSDAPLVSEDMEVPVVGDAVGRALTLEAAVGVALLELVPAVVAVRVLVLPTSRLRWGGGEGKGEESEEEAGVKRRWAE